MEGHGKARHGEAGRGRARQGKAFQCMGVQEDEKSSVNHA